MKLSEIIRISGGSAKGIIVIHPNDAMKAVEQDGDALRYVKEQSEAVCLKAVEQNGYALRYVKEQSEAVCLKAVEQDGDALQYVDIRLFEIDVEITYRK